MSALFIVLPLALLVVLVGVGAYLWAARRGQFDDLTTPALRMLHDDERRRRTTTPLAETEPVGPAPAAGMPPGAGEPPA
jgi:cbb3-type cytochrome oxidase maturation protein